MTVSQTPETTRSADPAPGSSSQAERGDQAARLNEAARQAPMHARDQVPRFVLGAQAWLFKWFSRESRVVLSLVIVVLAVAVAVVLSSSKILRFIIDGLDIVAVAGLFLVNWLGNGGVLVPIPGARFIGLLLIFQQAVILPSWEVFAAAGAGMALGLLSYYLAGARTAQSYADGDADGAVELAQDTGMLDRDALEFSPGADLEDEAVSSISGVHPVSRPDPEGDPDTAADDEASASRTRRLRNRFTTTLRRAQERAKPIIEQRGFSGMFLLCFAPTPLSTAGAYVGGLVRFGFTRYLVASFAAKYLLAGIIVALALMFGSTAASVQIPELHIPIINLTLFGDGVPSLPEPSPSPPPRG